MSSVENYIPYSANAEGFTQALIDLKSTMPSQTVFKVTGYETTCFEDVVQGQVLYSRASDGQVGKAIASDTLDKATVAGVAETSKSAGQSLKVIVAGIVATSGLDLGDQYYLSAASAGAIVKTPPSSAGQYISRIGEAGSTGQLIIRIEPPILLS
jgi:hypothetical protein|tara:strand:+ start:6333 stop:6797 length:465 start_codon:yes stop_codon:yes gene_type:complete